MTMPNNPAKRDTEVNGKSVTHQPVRIHLDRRLKAKLELRAAGMRKSLPLFIEQTLAEKALEEQG